MTEPSMIYLKSQVKNGIQPLTCSRKTNTKTSCQPNILSFLTALKSWTNGIY
jgi:hypothetical protein